MATPGTGKGKAAYVSKAAVKGEWMAIPKELPPEPTTEVDKTRQGLIGHPGNAAPLDEKFRLRRDAERVATNFRRARPKRGGEVLPGAFGARAFEDTDGRWGVAVWYDAGAKAGSGS